MKKYLILFLFCLSLFAQDGNNESNSSSSNSSSNSSSDSNSSGVSSTGTQQGIILKGGFWGLGGTYKSQFESLSFRDDLLGGFGLGQVDLAWSEQKKNYFLNPIGIDYYRPMGSGSLLLAFDARGLPFARNSVGFSPQYDFNSIDVGGNIGIHKVDKTYRNYDFTVGYQIGVLNNQLLITPKLIFRDFTNDVKFDSIYLGNTLGVEKRDYKAPGSATYLGANFLYNINDVSAVFFDYSFSTGILMPKLGPLFDDRLTYSKQYFSSNSIGLVLNGEGVQKISGNRLMLGYQHKFGNLGVQIGYHTEQINSKYESNFELPISISRNGFGIGVNEILSNRFFAYPSTHKTEIRTIYFGLTYSL
jgi:hypothetical protein